MAQSANTNRPGRPPSLEKELRRLARQNGHQWLETVDRAARLGDAQAAAWLADRALEQVQPKHPGS